MMVSGRTVCHPNPALRTVCTTLTSVIVLSGSTVVGLRSGGSICIEGVVVFVLDRSRLLGGPSPCSGVVWVTAASG